MDFIFRNIDASLNSAKQRYLNTGKVSPNIFKFFFDVDYTASKKYLEWLCRMYDRNVIDGRFIANSTIGLIVGNLNFYLELLDNMFFTDFEKRSIDNAKKAFSEAFRDYEKGVQSGVVPVKDINKIEYLTTFADYVDKARSELSWPPLEKVLPSLREGIDYSLLDNSDPHWTLVLIKTYKASKLLGGTRGWCVVQAETHFEAYFKKYDFMIFAFKKNRFLSYCLHIRISGVVDGEVYLLLTNSVNEIESMGVENSERVMKNKFGFDVRNSVLYDIVKEDSFVVYQNISFKERFGASFEDCFNFSEASVRSRPAFYVSKARSGPDSCLRVEVNNKSYGGYITIDVPSFLAKDFESSTVYFVRNSGSPTVTFRVHSQYLEDIDFFMRDAIDSESNIVFDGREGTSLALRCCEFANCIIDLKNSLSALFSRTNFSSSNIFVSSPVPAVYRGLEEWSLFDEVSDLYTFDLEWVSFFKGCSVEGNFVFDRTVKSSSVVMVCESCIVTPKDLEVSHMRYNIERNSGCSVGLPIFHPILRTTSCNLFALFEKNGSVDYPTLIKDIRSEFSQMINMRGLLAELKEQSGGLNRDELLMLYCKAFWEKMYVGFFEKNRIEVVPWVVRAVKGEV